MPTVVPGHPLALRYHLLPNMPTPRFVEIHEDQSVNAKLCIINWYRELDLLGSPIVPIRILDISDLTQTAIHTDNKFARVRHDVTPTTTTDEQMRSERPLP